MANGLQVRITASDYTPQSVLGSGPGRSANEVIVLPAVLNDVEVTQPITFGNYDSVGAGSFTVRRGGTSTARELRSFSFDVYASDADWPFLQAEAPATWDELRDRVQGIAAARFPVRVRAIVVAGDVPADHFDINMDATIGTFNTRLTPGQPEARYFTVGMTEYRDAESTTEAVQYSRVRGTHFPHVHKVRPGDSLGSLAASYYGAWSLWKTIAQNHNNRGVIRKLGAAQPFPSSVKKVTVPKPPPFRNPGLSDAAGL